MFWKWPISIIGKMLNIGADNRSTPSLKFTNESEENWVKVLWCLEEEEEETSEFVGFC